MYYYGLIIESKITLIIGWKTTLLIIIVNKIISLIYYNGLIIIIN